MIAKLSSLYLHLQRLYWTHTVGSHKLEFGIPFSIGSKRLLDCQYGVQYKKPKPPTSNRVHLQGSKKKGCGAHVEVIELTLYPEYRTTSLLTHTTSKKQCRKVKEELLQSLKQELKTGKVRDVVHKYLVRLPTEEAHHTCHPTKGAMGFSQRIHPDLILKIQELVSTGITEPLVVQRLLRQHVLNCMCASNPADPNDRSYFPILDDVRNHVYKAISNL